VLSLESSSESLYEESQAKDTDPSVRGPRYRLAARRRALATQLDQLRTDGHVHAHHWSRKVRYEDPATQAMEEARRGHR
jgi:hypothetical protein